MSTPEEGNQIYYTIDGSDPNIYSLKYTKPLSFNKSTNLLAVAIDHCGVPSFIRQGTYTKATFSIRYKYPPSPKYPGKDQLTLLDGRKGSLDFSGGEWLGWEGEDMIVTIDYNETKSFSKASADFIHDQGSWIFPPTEVTFEVSTDGKNYKVWGREKNSEFWDLSSAKHREFGVSGQNQFRFVRITAKSMGNCPKGHAGEGGKAWLFCDEITIQ